MAFGGGAEWFDGGAGSFDDGNRGFSDYEDEYDDFGGGQVRTVGECRRHSTAVGRASHNMTRSGLLGCFLCAGRHGRHTPRVGSC